MKIELAVGTAALIIALMLIPKKSKGEVPDELPNKVPPNIIPPEPSKLLRPVTGKITSPFGYRTHPVTGIKKLHNGVDFSAPVGTQIYSPEKGVVKGKNFNSAGGNQLFIDHVEKGLVSGYAHLTKTFVDVGQNVERGQLIALSGNTGQTTGPHLHFTLTNSIGIKVDPEKYFA